MKLDQLRIGYVPYDESLNRPGDKRRFVHYAKKRNLSFEIADPSKSYDLVVLTAAADISVWSHSNLLGAKVVFELINSYLAIPRDNLKGKFRGLVKYISGQSRRLQINYWTALEMMCEKADAVVCTTEEQKHDIQPFCENVRIIPDIHTPVSRTTKQNYGRGEIVNLVWEGLPVNASSLYLIQEALLDLQTKYEIAVHVITDLEYNRYLGRYGRTRTADAIHDVCDNVFLYEWNEQMFSTIACSCDMAVIPLNLRDPFEVGKPENKLMLLWQMGIPTIVSATPAYMKVMESAGLPMACATVQEWKKTIEKYILDESARRYAGLAGKSYAQSHHSEEATLLKWDALFESL